MHTTPHNNPSTFTHTGEARGDGAQERGPLHAGGEADRVLPHHQRCDQRIDVDYMYMYASSFGFVSVLGSELGGFCDAVLPNHQRCVLRFFCVGIERRVR